MSTTTTTTTTTTTATATTAVPILGSRATMDDNWQLTITKLCENGAVRTQPNSQIVTQLQTGGYHRMSMKDCAMIAKQIASALMHRGYVHIGDRVGTLMWNNARHLALYYAVPCMGCVLHAINFKLHAKELQYIITHADDRVLFVDADILPAIEKLDPQTFQNINAIIVCGANMQPRAWRLSPNSPFLASNNASSHLCTVIDFEDLLIKSKSNSKSNSSMMYEWPALDERSCMGLCYTSGTTGLPKGVAYSHKSMFLHTMALMATDAFNLSGTDCILPLMPMFHAMHWGFGFFMFAVGCKILLHHNCPIAGVIDMCVDEGCTFIGGVPTVMQMFQSSLIANPSKYGKIRGVLTRAACGGSAPSGELIEYFYNEWGVELIQLWGMTEGSGAMGLIARRKCRRKDLTVSDTELINNSKVCGIAPVLNEVKIVDLQNLDRELPHDGKAFGELLVRGPHFTTSYYGLKWEAIADKFHDGWLRTGDIALITPAEQVVIVDRLKDVIKSGGEWISSKDMENYATDNVPAFEMACVVAAYHPKWDERPVLIAKLKAGQSVTKEEVLEILRHNYTKYQLPDDVLFWDDIPLTASGKISKKIVRARLAAEEYVLPTLALRLRNSQSKHENKNNETMQKSKSKL